MLNRFAVSLVAVAAIFLMFTLVNNLLLGGLRLDLTANKLYTLSSGTREILEEIDEPINLYFFFSGKVSEDLTSLRSYALRVQEMLEEYELRADGKIKLHLIDPEPFSEEEDQAAGFGLQHVPVNRLPTNQSGKELYFGLAGTNALDDREVIPFFQLDREEFLEYELSKLIYSLNTDRRPVLGIFSSLPVTEQTDPTTYQVQPAWVIVQQLQELFQVRTVSALSGEELAGLELLLLIHPNNLDTTQQFGIDQFVMAGGKLLVFVDPLAEMAGAAAQPPAPPNTASELNALLGNWGVRLRPDEVLGDAEAALLVSDPADNPGQLMIAKQPVGLEIIDVRLIFNEVIQGCHGIPVLRGQGGTGGCRRDRACRRARSLRRSGSRGQGGTGACQGLGIEVLTVDTVVLENGVKSIARTEGKGKSRRV